jgi:hypothetical protein
MTWTERLRALGAMLREPPALLALGFNLVPAVCVLLFGWSAAILLLLYWAENVVIGVFNIFRLLVVGARDGVGAFLGAVFHAVFFVIHYGMFCLVHGVFALTFLGFERGMPNDADMAERLLPDLPRYLDAEQGFVAALLAILALQAVSFVQWLVHGTWKTADGSTLFHEPYARIITLHISLFAMAFALGALGNPVFGVFALVLLKSAAEGVFAGRKARKDRAATV